MDDFGTDPLWLEYRRASGEHDQAVQARVAIERELMAAFSDETLRQWDDAHREQESCYEQVKAAERAVWAKFHNS